MNKRLLKLIEYIANKKYDGCFEIVKTKAGYILNFPFEFKEMEDLSTYETIEDAMINAIQENINKI